MNQSNQINCVHHPNHKYESMCVKTQCCNELKCQQCQQGECRIVKLRIFGERLQKFKVFLNKTIQQLDIYNKNLLTILQQNGHKIVVEDIINTENIIHSLKDHVSLIHSRSNNIQQDLLQAENYESMRYCNQVGHEQWRITSINRAREPGQPFLLCELCQRIQQNAIDLNTIKRICEHYVVSQEINEIKNLQLQVYDQYFKKFNQLTNIVEEQTMYNQIKDKLAYFNNPILDIQEIFDDNFMRFLEQQQNNQNQNANRSIQLVKTILKANMNLDLDNLDNVMLHQFYADFKFNNQLPSKCEENDQLFVGRKMTAKINLIKCMTIYDNLPLVLACKAMITFYNDDDKMLEKYTVSTSGAIWYNDQLLHQQFNKQIPQNSIYKINFYLFLVQDMEKSILISYQGQMILQRLRKLNGIKTLQVSVQLEGQNAHGRIVTQTF